MSNSLQKQIDKLWEQFRVAIDSTYQDSKDQASCSAYDGANCLRDYCQNMSWHDALKSLLNREIENERQHRRGHPPIPKGFSAHTASMLLLMQNAKDGALGEGTGGNMIPATWFLVMRPTAAEARVIGFLCRGYLTPEWLDQVSELDYAKLMGSK